ncbi:23S rRNA (adenine(2503)-C(2))-methyltransferase RlmN [Opitutales bacterium ASA1]|uniref:23S rRNA (adenine(2503)-C(2))-methyltransferase RlmN n=1 Tax=Congregicoccus parvus TaxID=3081749 RepID=UPI002B289F9B|nr:23S rRNA (adenine(2503)-C(2))-methyltransferase RlmN [Opitutales bacterium ASA1]
MQQSLLEFDRVSLEAEFACRGFKPAHASEVLRALYRSGTPLAAARPSRELPRSLVAFLREWAGKVPGPTLAARQEADDGTVKLLLRLLDGRTVESVLMPDYRGERAAGCVSSQVGCAMGCDFCATTRTGFERNLSVGEIVAQFLALRTEAARAGRRLHTLVFMGMGEPMLNLDNVIEAVRRIGGGELGALGWRQITVSTVGIVPGIQSLDATGLAVNLAVSLHAPDDATRARLLPPGRRFAIAEILGAMDEFQARRGRPTIIQYCLLAGVNDSLEHAHALADVLGARRTHVNLLTYNATGTSLRGVNYLPTDEDTARAFQRVLSARGLVAHFRRSRGPEIDAACGQLRRRVG